MRLRMIQLLLVAAVVAAGTTAYRNGVRPREDLLRQVAEAPLRDMFSSGVEYDGPVRFDLAEGVTLRGLRVPYAGGEATTDDAPRYGLEAQQVVIRHDTLALAAGRYRPVSIEIDGARILTRETKTGIAPEFPLELSSGLEGSGPLPSIRFRDAELIYRARAGSERLREGARLRIVVPRLSLVPDEEGTLRVEGELRTRDLGQDQARVTLAGTVAPSGRDFDLVARWDPLELTPQLLAVLTEELAKPLRQGSVTSGTFSLQLVRHGGVAEGAIDVAIDWHSQVEISVEDLPGLSEIDATTKEQMQELFGGGALQLEVGEGRINIKSLVTEMAGGRVSASGWVIGETGQFHLTFDIRDLRLEDAAVRRALGPEGAAIYDEFDPHGVVDARGEVIRGADGQVEWKVDVLLENASLRYVGSVGENGRREGFPYRVEDATGRVRIDSGGVEFGTILGFNRGAEVEIVGYGGEAWTGGETGRIRFTDDGADVRLTVIATNVPFDEELREAIEGSEFVEMMSDFDLRGVIDRIEVDIIRIPGLERAAKGELRITLEGEEFRYTPFPLPLEDVRGQITMRRPVLEQIRRGRVFAFDVTGWAEGAPIRVSAEIVDHESRGRLHVLADGVPLAGAVTEAVLNAPATAEGLGRAWRWLGPRGKAVVEADLPLADDPGPLHLTARLLGASIRLDAEGGEAPVEFDDLQGTLEVLGDEVRLEEVTGSLGDAHVRVTGVLQGGLEGRWDLHASVDSVRVTPTLQGSLERLAGGDTLLPNGMRFEPGSRLGLDLELSKAPGADAPLEAAYTARDLDTVIRMAEGATMTLRGRSLSVRGGVVTAEDLRVSSEGLAVVVPAARLRLGESLGVSGRFELEMEDYTLSEGVLGLVPPSIADLLREWTSGRELTSEGFRVDAPQTGPVSLHGELTLVVPPGEKVGEGPRGRIAFEPLVVGTGPQEQVELSGTVRIHGFAIDLGIELRELDGAIHVDHLRLGDRPDGAGRLDRMSGKVIGVRVKDLSAPITWRDDVLQVPSITGFVVGGALCGRLALHTAAPHGYEGSATVSGFDVALLREDLAPTGAPYAGRGNAQVTFQSRGGDLRDLTAGGHLHIRNGALGELPFLANIFVLVGELLSDDQQPQFERADLEFVLRDEIFHFRRFDLAGPLFDMPGSGTLDTTGVVDLRFTPDFIKGLILPGVMQLPVVGPVLRTILREEILYAVRVHGDLESAKPEVVALPPLGLDRGRDFAGTGARTLPRRKVPRWFR